MSELGIPVDLEKSVLNSDLNSTILSIFLMGMYTIIYFGTIYLYHTRNSANRYLVPGVITILFLTNIVQTVFQWYSTKWQFINNGDTRDSVFLSGFEEPQWLPLMDDISSYLGVVLPDGLLIWRCYHVWNRSVRIISVTLLLVITEAVLFLTDIIIRCIFADITVPAAQATKYNDMLGAAYFISFGTSLVSTILIAYRIYAVLKQEGTSARRFRHVLDIVVQSGVIYSLSLFVAAISSVAPGADNILNATMANFQDYVLNVYVPIAGISTTILVARVAMLAPTNTFPSTAVHLSALEFNARSTHHTNAPERMETMNVDKIFSGEQQEVDGKAQ